MIRRLLPAGLLLALALSSPVLASLDPELDKPYRLQVVLHIAQNRFLTEIFQDQVQRELRDQLQLSLGRLASVEVVRDHPQLPNIESSGLESALDDSHKFKLGDVKTHFVLLDYAAGVYTLQSRQHDGLTGLASPVVRKVETSDRTIVARLAAQLVEQDFGLVGTVIEAGKDEVRLGLRGGKLAPKLDAWIKPGEVFAISRIVGDGNKVRAQRVEWALLEVLETPADGVCRCRLWHRFQEVDLKDTPGVLGYRALKLTTQPARLRLRLLDDRPPFEPLAGVVVHAFRPGDKKPSELSSNRDGLAVSREPFNNFVHVKILSGDSVRAKFPVPLVDDRPVVCKLNRQAEADAQAPVDFRRDQWVTRIYDNLRLADERVKDLNQRLGKSLEDALGAAKNGVTKMAAELENVTRERDDILRQAADRKIPNERLDLSEGIQRLADLKEKHKELEQYAARLEKAFQESKSEKTLGLAKLLERARLSEGEADYDGAIALYEKVLAAAPDQTKVREQLEKLRKAWAPKSETHAQARTFLCQDWPKLDVRDLKEKLEKAQNALKICREAGDGMTPKKMVQANVAHVANLKKHLDELLRRRDSEDNRSQVKAVTQVAEALGRLHAEAAALAAKKTN
ncbi:MAG: hypothetical protein HY040_04220 [Planctomycetes bacterium]|nr:hypothetical protein [Planctomycetota bacterium]